MFYPVFVDGANLSMGDLHFSQGDGEITFCGAIEMGGFIDLHVDLIKGGMETYGVCENAIFMPGTIDPQFSQLAGVLRHLGHPRRRAALSGLAPVLPAGLSARHRLPRPSSATADIQAYMILGSAPIEGRLSGVVDIPNSCSTVYIPTEIFDIDVRPSAAGPAQIDPGMGVPMSSADG